MTDEYIFNPVRELLTQKDRDYADLLARFDALKEHVSGLQESLTERDKYREQLTKTLKHVTALTGAQVSYADVTDGDVALLNAASAIEDMLALYLGEEE